MCDEHQTTQSVGTAFIYKPTTSASNVKTDFIARYIHYTHIPTHCEIVHSRHVVSTRVHGDKYRTFEVTISRTLLSNTYSHTLDDKGKLNRVAL